MKRLLCALLLGLTAACTPAATQPPASTPMPPAGASLTRTDAQGAVTFAVTPLNLTANAPTLEFAVVMDTHAVDLSWDLAAQAVLQTDTGLEVAGQRWTPGSGHHYENTLVFPAQTAAGQPLLTTAQTLTLVIRDTDVPERTFVWQLTP